MLRDLELLIKFKELKKKKSGQDKVSPTLTSDQRQSESLQVC